MATLEERMAGLKQQQSGEAPAQAPNEGMLGGVDTEVAGRIQNLNIGLANILGAPVDMVSNLLKASGIMAPDVKPVLGTESVREFFTNIGATPEVGKEQKDFTARALRLAGETAVPFLGAQTRGAQLARKAPEALNHMQRAILAAYQSPWKAVGAETTAVLGGALGGETAAQVFPENHVAEALGELLGGVTPGAVSGLVRALPGPRTIKSIVSGEGAQLRAGRRVGEMAGDVDTARLNALQASELDLDPITASGDAGLLALEKAALDADPKLAERVAKLTSASMAKARKLVTEGGDPAATVDYLKGLRRKAAAEAQAEIIKLGNDVDPVTASRAVRTSVENALSGARKVETDKWGKLPTKGVVNPQPIVDNFESLLSGRTIASDPEEIPAFVYSLIGRPDAKGVFQPGAAVKHPTLGVMKDLRSRLQREMAVERAKDAANRNKIRILGELQDEVFNSLAEYSPEYADAVDYSRKLNQSFTQGKIGSMLGYERTGELSTSAEGTLDFLTSGNKDDVRMGLRQLAQASPEAIPMVKENIKATFNIQALDPESGALNVRNARRFLKSNSHVLDEFPDIKQQIEQSVSSQRVVDELVGAPVGDKLSTYLKDKSVTALYLEGTPEAAMHRLVTSKNRQAAGSVMKQMIDLTNQDPTGQATKGLKSAFGSYLLKHSETGDVGNLSGKKFLNMLVHLGDAAKALYTEPEMARVFRIGTELRKIEARGSARAARGGVLSDTPSKIIKIIGGTFAARAGAKAGAGTSGAPLRTASIFTREYNELLGRLTNDGAAQILMKAVEDPVVLQTLLKEASPENIVEANKVFRSFLTGQALSSLGSAEGEAPELSLEGRMDKLRKSQGQQQ